MDKNEWRRFEIIKPEREQELMRFCETHAVTRSDLIMILTTIKMRNVD